MTAPVNLPPVRRPKPSGVHVLTRRPWWSKPDFLCIAALILGLIGALPHVTDDVVRILNALHGTPTANATPGETGNGKSNGSGGNPNGQVFHDPSMALDSSVSTIQTPAVTP